MLEIKQVNHKVDSSENNCFPANATKKRAKNGQRKNQLRKDFQNHAFKRLSKTSSQVILAKRMF